MRLSEEKMQEVMALVPPDANLYQYARAIEAAVLAEQKAAIPQTMIERMKHAVEGECDGLAITDDHARAILQYVLAEQQPHMWSFTGSTRLMDEHEARLEAKRCGGTTKAFPLYRAPVVQPDMILVPREPTEAMIDAVIDERMDALVAGVEHTFIDIYRAMIAAAAAK